MRKTKSKKIRIFQQAANAQRPKFRLACGAVIHRTLGVGRWALGVFRTALLAVVLLIASSFAAEPALSHLFPIAGQQGTTIEVTASGKFDPWPTRVWVDAPGITFKPAKAAGKFDVEIAKDAAPGPHLVRLFNEQGASAPRFFIVSREPEILEAEPNDDFKTPQKIASLPATISGRLEKAGDVDSFAVTLKQGQTLVAWMEAFVFGSPFDGMLRILGKNGTQLAFNHDGRTLDPFIAWKAPHDGMFIVQTMGFNYPPGSDVRFTGGENCIYRLHLTAGPFARYTLPLAAQRGKKMPLELVGWNLGSPRAEIDGTQVAAGSITAEQTLAGIATDRPIDVSDLPEAMEKEPNDLAATAQPVEIPGAVTGGIERADDVDRFAFKAIKNRAYALAITAARVGSRLEPSLGIEDAAGKELARSEGTEEIRDPALTWIAPSDGVYTAVIGDITHRGGEGFVYRLAITEAVPSVVGSVNGHSFSVQPGKSAEVKVAVKRANRFQAKLQVVAKNLPEGVSAEAVEVPEKDGEVTLKMSAAADAKPSSQPMQIVLREVETGAEHPVRHFIAPGFKNEGAVGDRSPLIVVSTEHLWLAVLPEARKPE
jgi:hypothetical protein